MTLLMLFLTLAAVAGTVRMVLRDDRTGIAPPRSRHLDPAALPPARLLDRR